MLRTRLILCAALAVATPVLAEPVTHFTLPNGLEAVVIEDHRALRGGADGLVQGGLRR